MNKKQLIQRCLISDDAIETYPFGQDVYKDTCVMRHKSNDKWFALIFYLDKKLYINVKSLHNTWLAHEQKTLDKSRPRIHSAGGA